MDPMLGGRRSFPEGALGVNFEARSSHVSTDNGMDKEGLPQDL